jgi:VanZ family protein
LTGPAWRTAWAVAALILAVLAAVAALLPPRGTPGVDVADLGETLALVLHLIGYAALALAAVMAQTTPRPVITLVVLLAYATALEGVQGLLGQRSLQAQDILANLIGIGLGVLAGRIWQRAAARRGRLHRAAGPDRR